MLLFSFCDCHWLIPWLLPFLLGLLLGWLLGAATRKRVVELEEENEALKKKLSDLESELSDCKSKRAALDSELTLLKLTIREKEQNQELSGSNVARGAVGVVPSVSEKPKKAKSRNIYSVLASDNLQVVEGIGPKMDEVLKKEGIGTWSDLAASTGGALRALLDRVNPKRYRIIDPTSWPDQAALADAGEWENLIELQKALDTGRVDKGGKQTDSKVEKLLIKLGALKRWKQDDLKAVEGIGPKIEGLLKAQGIDTWRKLSQTGVERITEILTEAGPRYRLAEPDTWPKQAEMAADGRWDDLDEYQEFLQSGK